MPALDVASSIVSEMFRRRLSASAHYARCRLSAEQSIVCLVPSAAEPCWCKQLDTLISASNYVVRVQVRKVLVCKVRSLGIRRVSSSTWSNSNLRIRPKIILERRLCNGGLGSQLSA